MAIISFILMTFMYDSELIMWGEISCWSLLGVKRLRPTGYNSFSNNSPAWATLFIKQKFQHVFNFILRFNSHSSSKCYSSNNPCCCTQRLFPLGICLKQNICNLYSRYMKNALSFSQSEACDFFMYIINH